MRFIKGMAETLRCLSQSVEDSAASIKRLMRYLFGAPTETAKKLFPKEESEKTDAAQETGEPKAPRKGHGRLGAASYTGGSRVKVPHPTLAAGTSCPECLKGKVYELALPSTVVRITGGAPLQATVFERGRLRCILCGQIFTPPEPEEAGQSKYDDSAAAMIAVLKYVSFRQGCMNRGGRSRIFFIVNFFWSAFAGKRVESDNPWQATTLEWATPTPPPHGNFATEPHVYRGPYEYSVPGQSSDYWPQNQA